MNPRERQVRAARRLIPDAQLIAFLRAVRGSTDLFAVKLVNEDLDGGKSLDEIFYTRMEYGYSLSAYKVAASGFFVSFGCEPVRPKGMVASGKYHSSGIRRIR